MHKFRVRSFRSRRLVRRVTVAGGAGLLVIASVTGLTAATAQQGPSKHFCKHHRKNAACVAMRNARKARKGVPTTADPTPRTTAVPAPTTTEAPVTTTTPPTTTPVTVPAPAPNPCASKIAGITLDDVDASSRIASGLSAMPSRTTSRVVFDENVNASYYVGPLADIHPVSNVMGELLDSSYVRQTSVSDYVARARSYLATLGNQVDIWEVGNEVNGNWLGSYPDVSAKITGAYNVANDAGKQTALTLYYNPNNVDGPGEPTPVEFSQQYVSPAMRAGLDYVLLSYYETDFNNYRPSAAVLTSLFAELHALYPNAVLGFGEVGLNRAVSASTLPQAASIMSYYYGLSIPLPYYCGGYFWWYGAEDILGTGALMPTHFEAALDSMP
jgi:hypothetical protein